MNAHLLSVSTFNMPLVLKEEYAMYQHLVQLILLEKGTYPSHPDMGVGLISRYRLRSSDRSSDVIADLSADISENIKEYSKVDWTSNTDIHKKNPMFSMIYYMLKTW